MPETSVGEFLRTCIHLAVYFLQCATCGDAGFVGEADELTALETEEILRVVYAVTSRDFGASVVSYRAIRMPKSVIIQRLLGCARHRVTHALCVDPAAPYQLKDYVVPPQATCALEIVVILLNWFPPATPEQRVAYQIMRPEVLLLLIVACTSMYDVSGPTDCPEYDKIRNLSGFEGEFVFPSLDPDQSDWWVCFPVHVLANMQLIFAFRWWHI
ncbi:hypothetical protein DFH09DRAFT_1111981 [Mycena vulgaris]|nr:hypothetical protein DFH09DRAFT_1111981 [Mycena vulgaris]